MIMTILDSLIVIGLITICSAIAWVDVEMRLDKRKKRKEARKQFEESIDISTDE
jgi:hypothetical protein